MAKIISHPDGFDIARDDGQAVAVLRIAHDRGTVFLADASGRLLAGVAIPDDHPPAISLFDAAGRPVAGVSIDHNGEPMLTRYGADGELAWAGPLDDPPRLGDLAAAEN